MDYATTSTAPDTRNRGKSECRAAYERLRSDREPYLRRARDSARLTVPWLVPDEGSTSSTDYPTPFQSTGARGVNNLAAKLLLTLFPPNAPFFEFRVDPYALEQVSQVKDAREQVEKSLVKASEAVLSRMETDGFRVAAHEVLKHLVVSGNAVLCYRKEGVRAYHLNQFVVERDPKTDHPLILILHEKIARSQLPAGMQVPDEAPSNGTDMTGAQDRLERTLDLFTHCTYDGKSKKWTCYQEVADVKVPDSEGTFTDETFEYLVLRGNTISGENYGRGYVEDYVGDLKSLEGLSQAIVEGAAACARLLFAVKPNSMTDVDELSRKPNGGYFDGNPDDVKAVQVEKFADFQVAGNTANAIKEQLAFAFLFNSSVQRNAERVTAEEIRFLAGELEQALGGIYTLLSREFQLPVVRLLTARMKSEKKLPELPKEFIHPSVVTGIEALGRGNDLNRIRAAQGTLVEMLGPQQAAAAVHTQVLAQRVYNAAGVRSDDLVKTSEEVAQEMQAAQQAELMRAATGPAITQGGGLVRDAMASNAQAPAAQ